MNIRKIYLALKFFTLPNKFLLLSFFIKSKIYKNYTFPDNPKIFERYKRVMDLQTKGVDIKAVDREAMLLTFLINNKTFLTKIRPLTSDIDVFVSIILGEEYKSVSSIRIKGKGVNQLIVDAGANIGLMSLYLHAFFPNCRLLCIEPDPDNYKILLENLALNKITNSTVVNKALWIKNEVLQLHSEFRDGEAWSKSIVPLEDKSLATYSVESYTMDELMDKFSDYPIFLFKMDIEGAEKFLFSSGKFVDQISSNVPNLIMEIHDELDIRDSICRSMVENKYFYIDDGDVTLFQKNLEQDLV